MNLTLFLGVAAFVAGFAWGFRAPPRYCNLSREEVRSFRNRISGGMINGIIFGAIVALGAYFIVGDGLMPATPQP